ncbi:hypothetical protein [Undibacterium crateris]|uniref:hypothetical protein n=1 Tax=Undibacterium crateris TaxID=2528175 RepID=UPI001F459512|nr:hypothetical protein [Undibacterium crateris]NDI87035.1 hypothetical protein [Undibacterium crateris]
MSAAIKKGNRNSAGKWPEKTVDYQSPSADTLCLHKVPDLLTFFAANPERDLALFYVWWLWPSA